jgi:molecular chaperone GrpE
MADPIPQAPAPEATPDAATMAQSYYDQLLRLKAEFENYRKRVDRDRPEYVRLGRAEVILKTLPIYDVLRLAHEQIQASHAETELARGMEGIFREFEKLFKEEGVVVMDPLGKPYDAALHEVVGMDEKSQAPDGQVVAVLQHGFLLNDKLLRPARVRIAKAANVNSGGKV